MMGAYPVQGSSPASCPSPSAPVTAMETTDETTIDVRELPPKDKHPTIFDTFGDLAPGETFVIINDHDPKPLYHEFQAERPGEMDWEYLQEGPEVWRVRIAKTDALA